ESYAHEQGTSLALTCDALGAPAPSVHWFKNDAPVYEVNGSTELSERSKLFPLAPRIVVSYKVYVDTIGSNVVLPCRVKGHPRPHVTWRDNKGVMVNNNPRMKAG
ncbi:Insulin-related peptide binding protein, partial [Operophtera brumata]